MHIARFFTQNGGHVHARGAAKFHRHPKQQFQARVAGDSARVRPIHHAGDQSFPVSEVVASRVREIYLQFTTLEKRLSIGMPQEDRLRRLDYLDWLPWKQVIDPDNNPKRTYGAISLVYAQSWLLFHFLHNRKDTGRRTSLSWQTYLDEMQSGRSRRTRLKKGLNGH